MTTTSPRATARLPLAAIVLSALLLTGCSGAGGGLDTVAREGGDEGAAPSAPGTERAGAVADRGAVPTDPAGDRSSTAGDAVHERAVISTGTVSLEARDVEGALLDVHRVVDEAGGDVSDERTATDDDGEVRRSRLVLRVPADRFPEAMTSMSRLDSATLRSSRRVSEDVTTQVIDVAARVRAQRASLERVELLLARAEDLRDIVAIESQLTRRQAELESLERQQAWLADQTTLATITVLVERPPGWGHRSDRTGFLAGLAAGWDALRDSTVVVLTAVGAVLPFAVVLALLGVPAGILLRRLAAARRRVSEGTAGRTP